MPSHPGAPRIGARKTALGDVPTAWKRPRAGTVVWLGLAVAIYDGFLVLSSPDGILDIRPFYSPSDALSTLERLGDDGRAAYRVFATADLGFIVVYTAFLITWLRFLRVRKGFRSKAVPWFGLVPGVFDLVETVSILRVLAGWPPSVPAWIWVAAFATPLKWASLLALAVLILVGEIRRRRTARRR